jgi:hypothetical protein
MKALAVMAVLAAVATTPLAGCQKARTGPVAGGGADGRYVGVGLYPAGDMWRQLARPEASTNAAAARIDDDEQVIVTLDTATGELRQCGALSGHCLAMNPWKGPAPATAPAALAKHAADLAAEAERIPTPPQSPAT